MTPAVHICAPPPTYKRIARGVCLDCMMRTRFIGFWADYYGWDETCIRCGREYADGEWISLDFRRDARRKSIESAKAAWRSWKSEIVKPKYEDQEKTDRKLLRRLSKWIRDDKGFFRKAPGLQITIRPAPSKEVFTWLGIYKEGITYRSGGGHTATVQGAKCAATRWYRRKEKETESETKG